MLYQISSNNPHEISKFIQSRPFPLRQTFGLSVTVVFDGLCDLYNSKTLADWKPCESMPNVLGNMDAFPFLYEGKCYLISSFHDVLDTITDYFQESIRIHAKRRRCGKRPGRTPISYWTDKELHPYWIALLLKEKLPFTYVNVRSAIDAAVYKQCNLFPVTILLALCKRLVKPDVKILDLCAGWGDRLITALVLSRFQEGIEYTGIDPNEALFAGYEKMIAYFAMDPTKFRMMQRCAETVILQSEYDLVWAFPPYFNAEIYSLETTQSSIAYPTLEEWRDAFLIKILQRGWENLKPGGMLWLCLNDIVGDNGQVQKYTEYALEKMSHFCHAIYEGCILIGSPHSPQPIFIFAKG